MSTECSKMSTASIKQCTQRMDECSQQIFEMTGGSTFLRIDLDVIGSNLHILQSKVSPKTEIMAVVKANAYGHGAVTLARHLSRLGVRHFAVATVSEGRQLREAGVTGLVQVLGNSVAENVEGMRQYQLTPTVSTENFVRVWARCAGRGQTSSVLPVSIKIDTGMSRNGCQPEQLPTIMKVCNEVGVPVHSLMTHFAQAWDDDSFTKHQLTTFMRAVEPYRKNGIKIHAANSAAILRGIATDMDLVRPGICLYGLPPDSHIETVQEVEAAGLRQALCWIVRPSLVKRLAAGRHVGYDQTYVVEQEETMATLPVGYADGYSRQLSNKGFVLTRDGQQQRVVGRVSMDAITVIVSTDTTTTSPFYVYSDHVTSVNSVAEVARAVDTIPYEVVCHLSTRLPRIYRHGNQYLSEDISLADQNGSLNTGTASADNASASR